MGRAALENRLCENEMEVRYAEVSLNMMKSCKAQMSKLLHHLGNAIPLLLETFMLLVDLHQVSNL